MKILFYFGHPAQYLFARNSLKQLTSRGHQIKIVIKTKDVLENLLQNDNLEYENILPKERGTSKLEIALSLVRRNIALFPIIIKFKPNLLIGTDATIAQIGKLLNIDRITILEDDYNIIKTLADITYPFTQTIFCPNVCGVGKWDKKKVGYEGYMKLGYLHPNIFKENDSILEKYQLKDNYVIIRLAKLTAHHDFGIKGINVQLLDKLIDILQKKSYQVILSTEDTIDKKYNSHILNINPSDMHNLLANALLLISDSQSMSVEAALLGVPSFRISSFVGKISVLEELEHNYSLTFGIESNKIETIFDKLEQLLSMKNLKETFLQRKDKMLLDKIDVSSFFTWFIENYPQSLDIVKKDRTYQLKFK